MMKKLVILGIAIMMLFPLAACKDDKDVLSNEAITQIKQSAVSLYDNTYQTVDEVQFYYYDKFNGNVVVIFNPDFGGREAWYDIFEIYYPNTNRIMVWSDGNLFNLPQSQEQGLLSTRDLEKIAKIHAREFDKIYHDSGTWI